MAAHIDFGEDSVNVAFVCTLTYNYEPLDGTAERNDILVTLT